MVTYKVTIRNGSGGRTTANHTAEHCHVVAQGHVKFLNGRGSDASLVAFYNAADVVSVEKVDAA